MEILKHPRYVDMEKCIACGTCAEKCPKKVDDAFNQGLQKRKAVYVEYAQAVPLKYAIDDKECIFFQKGKCRACEKFCPTKAIRFEDKEEKRVLRTGAIILAPGFRPYDPSRYETYKYAKYPNVVTSMEFERILSATGPYQGHLVRPSDHKAPQKIAWLQCVGSRDLHHCDHGYCSSVCCMYAIKEAVIAKEHAGKDLDCAIFYMDMRTHGKDFERYYDDAREKHGIRFIRSRVPTIEPVKGTDDLLIPYVNDGGKVVEERFDMVVLSVGLEVSPEAAALAGKLGLRLTEGGFCETRSFQPVQTSRDGVYVCGAFQGPKDIPQSVIEASSAAAEAGALLSRGEEYPHQREGLPRGEERRREETADRCVRVPLRHQHQRGRERAGPAWTMPQPFPSWSTWTDNLFTCSTDTQDTMAQVIREKNLNRIVVAACTPKTHEPLFQETLVNAGLNKYLFEMTNIRNQDSWVHKDDPQKATEKAMDLVRMAVARVALAEPLQETTVEINQTALVVGGGISGMAAAKTLSAQGYRVSLVERSACVGRTGPEPLPDLEGGGHPGEPEDPGRVGILGPEHRRAPQFGTQPGRGVRGELPLHPEPERHGADGGARRGGDRHGGTGAQTGGVPLRSGPPGAHTSGAGSKIHGKRSLPEKDQNRSVHPVRGFQGAGTALLLQGLLHPFHGKRPSPEAA